MRKRAFNPMENIPLSEVAELAGTFEEKAGEIYEQLGEAATSKNLQAFYLKLAKDERNHQSLYMQIAQKAKQAEPIAWVSAGFYQFIQGAFKENEAKLSSYVNNKNQVYVKQLNDRSGVMLAQLIEESMVIFYEKMQRNLDNPFGDTVSRILRTEKAHLAWVNDQLNKQTV